MRDDIRVSERLTIPAAELQERFSRSSGPGGQRRDKSDTRVELLWEVTASATVAAMPAPLQARLLANLAPRMVNGVVRVDSSEESTQGQNRRIAVDRLRELVVEALRPPPRPRRPTKPSAGSVQRRLNAKGHRSAIKKLRRGGE